MTDLDWQRARQLAYAAAEPLPPVDVALTDAIGHVLAAPLCAAVPLPPFDTAAMDGFAVAGVGPWRITGRRPAGAAPGPELAAGTAVEISTGAAVPAGARAVLPYEDAGRAGELVTGEVAAGQHIRRCGEECRAGEELAGTGARVTPALVGLAAAVGLDTLSVRRRPRVAVVVSGDELLTAGLPRDGRIRDALGPQLDALIRGCRGTPIGCRHVVDDADAFAAELRAEGGSAPDDRAPTGALDRRAAEAADVVVTTGSTSAGRSDHLLGVLGRLGARVLVRGVACRPGHPQVLARLPDGRWVVGLPGNPLAALAGVVTLLAPLLARLGGHPMPRSGSAPTGGIAPHPTATRLVPVVFDLEGAAWPLDFGGPAMLRGVARADGLAVIPPGIEMPHEAQVVPIPGAE